MSFVIDISSDDEDDDDVQVLEFRKRTQDLINEAPPKVVKKLNEAECPICFDTVTHATTTFCGHVYCLECLQQSLSASSAQGQTRGKRGVGLCPMCRKSAAFKDALVLRLRTGRKVEPPKEDQGEEGERSEEKIIIGGQRGQKRKLDGEPVNGGTDSEKDDLDDLFEEK